MSVDDAESAIQFTRFFHTRNEGGRRRFPLPCLGDLCKTEEHMYAHMHNTIHTRGLNERKNATLRGRGIVTSWAVRLSVMPEKSAVARDTKRLRGEEIMTCASTPNSQVIMDERGFPWLGKRPKGCSCGRGALKPPQPQVRRLFNFFSSLIEQFMGRKSPKIANIQRRQQASSEGIKKANEQQQQ